MSNVRKILKPSRSRASRQENKKVCSLNIKSGTSRLGIMNSNHTCVMTFYNSVIEDTILSCRDIFADEGIDEGVLHELKHLWQTKLNQNKAVQNDEQPTSAVSSAAPNRTASAVVQHQHTIVRPPPPKAPQTATIISGQHPQTLSGYTVKTLPPSAPPVSAAPANVVPVIQSTGKVQQLHTAGASLVRQLSGNVNTTSMVTTTATMLADTARLIPIQITLPQGRVVHIHVPQAVLVQNRLPRLLTSSIIQATMGMNSVQASNLLQQHINANYQTQATQVFATKLVNQLDGQSDETTSTNSRPESPTNNDTVLKQKILNRFPPQLDGSMGDGSSDDEKDLDIASDDMSDDSDDNEQDSDERITPTLIEEEPLNSDDDISDDDPVDQFETDNVVVCQYDKVNRIRNKWRVILKDGIMNLNGRDFIFQRIVGDADW